MAVWEAEFLSTPSARRATVIAETEELELEYFYPRPPRGGRRLGFAAQDREKHFYPRPPRGGRLLFLGLHR